MNKMLLRIIKVWFCVVMLNCSCYGQSDIELIDDFVMEIMAMNNVPGLSLAVVKDVESFYAQGYGVKDIETLEPVTEDTLFYLASCTKHMTSALLVQQMANNGSIDLESPVKPILGDDFYSSDYYRTINANSRDLMAHRMNVPMSDYGIISGEVTDRMEHIRRTQYWYAVTQFRSDSRYSNTMVTVAGVLAGILANENSYEDAMRKNLFEPLEMYDTTFSHLLSEEQKTRLASGHQTGVISGVTGILEQEAMIAVTVDAPSGGGVSTARDLVKWLQFQLSGGRGPAGDVIVDEDVLEQTRTTQFMSFASSKFNYKPYLDVNYAEETYGLGLGLGSYREYKMTQHSGSLFGYWSEMMMLPEMGMGVFVIVNGPEGWRAFDSLLRVKLFVMDILLGETPWVNATYPPPSYPTTNEAFSIMHTSSGDSQFEVDIAQESLEVEKLLEFSAIKDADYSSHVPLPNYQGMYGHFALGNISVEYNETGSLNAYYGTNGVFRLALVNDEDDPLNHVFLAYASDPWWYLPPVRCYFNFEDEADVPYALTVPIMLPPYPPVFYRDLDQANAPDPPTSC